MNIRNGMRAAELPGVTWRKSRRSGPQGGNCVEVDVNAAFMPYEERAGAGSWAGAVGRGGAGRG